MEICAYGWLVWLLAIGSTTPRSALLLLILVGLLLVLCRIMIAVCRRCSFELPIGGTILMSFGMAALLCALIQRWLPNAEILQPTSPLIASIATLCGAAAHENDLLQYRTVPVLLLVGIIREILSAGSLWGIQLLPMELSPAFASGSGGLLVGAIVLWCCGLHPALFRFDGTVLPYGILGTAVTIGSLIGLFTGDLPFWSVLWGAVLLGAVCTVLLPTRYASVWLPVLTPLAALLTREAGNRWLPPLLGIGILGIAWLTTALVRYQRLTASPKRFEGVPSALVVTAMIYSLITAI